MLHIAIQIRDLISSNVSSVADGASNPAKTLRQLRGEIEEAIISLTGDLSRARSRIQRLTADITQLDLREADWSDRAALAMQSDREDLARAALLEREKIRETIAARQLEMAASNAETQALAESIASLEAKLGEAREKLADVEQAQCAAAGAGFSASHQSRVERHLHRIDTMERRADFLTENASLPNSAKVKAELEALKLDRKITAELDLLRAKATKAPRKR